MMNDRLLTSAIITLIIVMGVFFVFSIDWDAKQKLYEEGNKIRKGL